MKGNKLVTGIFVLAACFLFSVPVMADTVRETVPAVIYTSESDAEEATETSEDTADSGTKDAAKSIGDTDAENAEDTDNTEDTADTEDTAETEEVSFTGKMVVNFARRFLGGKYRYGGSSLTNGTDCSGFTMSVYNNFGVSLPHSSKSQRSVGTAVSSLEEAEAGDLICYSGHVALYIGDGQIIHALNERKGIIISDARYNNILAIRRVL